MTIRRDDTLDFEITFFEGVLKHRPDFVEALIAIGELYTRKGLYGRGLQVDKRLSRLRPDDPVVLYNLACSYCLTGDMTRALRALKKAIACGYNDFEYLNRDSDLDALRKDRRFKRLMAALKITTTGTEKK